MLGIWVIPILNSKTLKFPFGLILNGFICQQIEVKSKSEYFPISFLRSVSIVYMPNNWFPGTLNFSKSQVSEQSST